MTIELEPSTKKLIQENVDRVINDYYQAKKQNTPSIYDIKYNTIEKSPYFFSRDTLKFFHQTMNSFKVKKSPSGRIFIYAKMMDHTGQNVGYTFREYLDNDLKTIYNNDGSMFYETCLTDIQNYIQEH